MNRKCSISSVLFTFLILIAVNLCINLINIYNLDRETPKCIQNVNNSNNETDKIRNYLKLLDYEDENFILDFENFNV